LPTGRHGPPSPNDHPAWSPAAGPGPWSAPRRRDRPGRPAGAGEHPLPPMLPAPAGTLAWTSPVSARRGQGGAAAGTPAKRRPWARVDPPASQHRPPPHHRFLSGPRTVGDHAARRPRGTSTRCAQPGWPAPPSHSRVRRGPDNAAAAPRTPEACPSGHLDARTPGHRTPGRWTSARPAGRTSPRRTGRGGQGNDRPGRRPDILAAATTRWAARPRPGHGAWGRSATQDGSAVTAPAPRP
jgi:hypothetical protein